uniref:AB hydrolase-1 domain-containing protein n=1 Tax=Anopheles epiroticus TaxID=199890 RepID=A0A182PJ13_9DIPT
MVRGKGVILVKSLLGSLLSREGSGLLLHRPTAISGVRYTHQHHHKAHDLVEEHDRQHDVEEVRIPVPYGEIAGKWWGPRDVRPVVCIHGWQDNAGTFDRLIPLLPKRMSFLALDLHGHGLSSRIPDGMNYHTLDNLFTLFHVMRQYHWKKLSLMGHSMGSIVSFLFTATFPDKVDFYVGIDALKPHIADADKFPGRLEKRLPQALLADARNREQSEPPSYPYDELIERLHLGTNKSVTREAAPFLLYRNTRKSSLHPDRYYFTRDSRLKFGVGLGWDQAINLEFAKRVVLPYLFIKAKHSPYYEDRKYFNEFVELVKQNNPRFELEFVDSTHHLHLTEPEKVAPIVNRFFEKYWKAEKMNMASKQAAAVETNRTASQQQQQHHDDEESRRAINSVEHHPLIRFIELQDKQNNVTEVQIPVPYGHIAGKWFGPKNVRPILCLHGWLDNSGTFDRLIPLLPEEVSFLAIDLPGHGYSSRIPDGMAYYQLDCIPLILSIMREYGWTKVSLMAHSMGAVIMFIFASLFPDKVDLLIGLDALKPLSFYPDRFPRYMSKLVLKFIQADTRNQEKSEPPSYTYEEMIDRLYEGTTASVSRETCPYLLQRNIKPSRKFPGKYYFDRDNRMKYNVIAGWADSVNVELAKRITAPFLTVKAIDSPYPGSKEGFEQMVAILKEANAKYEVVYVPGSHHVHLTEPEHVVPVVVDFLRRYWRKEVDVVQEVRIPVPFGELAGKWWGPRNVRPIVCLHGWQDNAGTFDTLIPLLPSHMSFLALDLPGHGYSSRIPDGMSYQPLNVCYLLHFVMQEYGWKQISLMSHSMGSVLHYVYAGLFPARVDFLISLDALKPQIFRDSVVVSMLSELTPELMKADRRNQERTEPPSYTYEETVDRLYEGAVNSITREACPFLLQRNLRKSAKFPNRYYFARDSRLKYGMGFLWSQEVNKRLAQNLTMPFLFVKATESPYWERKQYYDEVIEILERNNSRFELRSVEGTHHVHLTHPERVAPIVTDFLNRYWQRDEDSVVAKAKRRMVQRNDQLHGVHEERIHLPFGDLIGKWLGPRDLRPIVCLHGWMDNAGTFDRLIPLLPRNISFLAIDIPGHGRSAHLPAGVAYNALDTLRLLLHLMQHYGWARLSLMSHSIGAVMSYVFAGVFPDRVDLLISFDLLKPFILDPDMVLFLLSDSLPKTLDYNDNEGTNAERKEDKQFEYDQYVEHMHAGFHESISREACHYLLYRTLEPSTTREGLYRRSTDRRIRHNHGLVWSHDVNLEMARRIKAPFLYLKTTETPLFEDPQYHQETIDVLVANNEQFEHTLVEGKHHVHLSHPERVAPV